MMRFLIFFGVALVLLIIVWPYLNRLGLGRATTAAAGGRPFGKLYVIIVTCFVLSVLLTGLSWWLIR
jgi:hypothetical protein